MRRYIILRDNYCCRRCGAAGSEVHHKIYLTPENINDPKVTLNPENLELLCRSCHQNEHSYDRSMGNIKDDKTKELVKEIHSKYIFDDQGNLVPNPISPPIQK